MLRTSQSLCVRRSVQAIYVTLMRLLRESVCAGLCCCLILSPLYALTLAKGEAPRSITPTRPNQGPRAIIPQAITAPHKNGEVLVKFRQDAPASLRDQVANTYGKGHKGWFFVNRREMPQDIVVINPQSSSRAKS